MPLTLTLLQESPIPLEVDSIRLDTARGQTPEEVSKTLIQRGNKQVEAGEFFRISGSAAEDNTLVFEGNCEKVKLIADHLTEGVVRVEGNAGMHTGAEMSGGEVYVSGNVGDWLGAEMHGGKIHVKGNAGHLVGAVYRGGRRGMTGGVILVEGNAGNEIGHTMRRGLIAVGGRSGDAVAFNMIAGSVFLFGTTGIRPGAGMRRGTIVYFNADSVPRLLPTFKTAETSSPTWLRFYLNELKSHGFPVPEACYDARFKRHLGDWLELGKGEVLCAVGDA